MIVPDVAEVRELVGEASKVYWRDASALWSLDIATGEKTTVTRDIAFLSSFTAARGAIYALSGKGALERLDRGAWSVVIPAGERTLDAGCGPPARGFAIDGDLVRYADVSFVCTEQMEACEAGHADVVVGCGAL